MYMQVYLHKTVLSADSLLRMIFKRVSDVLEAGIDLHFASLSSSILLRKNHQRKKDLQESH